METKKWNKIAVTGLTIVSDFTNLHCTHSDRVEVNRADLGKPGSMVARPIDGYYYAVFVDHYDGDDVYLRMDNKVYKAEAGAEYKATKPLSYAWAETVLKFVYDPKIDAAHA